MALPGLRNRQSGLALLTLALGLVNDSAEAAEGGGSLQGRLRQRLRVGRCVLRGMILLRLRARRHRHLRRSRCALRRWTSRESGRPRWRTASTSSSRSGSAPQTRSGGSRGCAHRVTQPRWPCPHHPLRTRCGTSSLPSQNRQRHASPRRWNAAATLP